MAKYNVKYWYLATGMEGVPDEQDYGIVEARSPKEACKIVAERENPDKPDLISWMLSCLHAEEVK